MSQFYPDEQIVVSLILHLNWPHVLLVTIDLEPGDFKAEHKSHVGLYLRWLAKYEHEAGELDIILCSGKKQEQIELLGWMPAALMWPNT